jgi:hypothetical protein
LDYRAVFDEETGRLTSYGWVDQAGGTVRIPIERAMDIIANDGLPARKEGSR